MEPRIFSVYAGENPLVVSDFGFRSAKRAKVRERGPRARFVCVGIGFAVDRAGREVEGCHAGTLRHSAQTPPAKVHVSHSGQRCGLLSSRARFQ